MPAEPICYQRSPTPLQHKRARGLGSCPPIETKWRFTDLHGGILKELDDNDSCLDIDLLEASLPKPAIFTSQYKFADTGWSEPVGPFYVPEPSASLLLVAGLVGLALIGRWKTK